MYLLYMYVSLQYGRMAFAKYCEYKLIINQSINCDDIAIDIHLYMDMVNGVAFGFAIYQWKDTCMQYAKQKHLGCKKCGANQKQHCKQAGATKRFDIS